MESTITDTQVAINLVASERYRQDMLQKEGRFRYTCASLALTQAERLAILAEEFGEVAREVLTQPETALASDTVGSREGLRKELVQVCAVGVAWIEALLDD